MPSSLSYRRRQAQGQEEQAAETDSECAFCLSVVRDGEEVRELQCHHFFHRACIDAWLVRPRTTCPLCCDRLLPAHQQEQLRPPLLVGLRLRPRWRDLAHDVSALRRQVPTNQPEASVQAGPWA